VVFLGRQVRWQNTSFNFAKRWYFPPSFLSVSVCTFSRPTLACNVPPLHEVANFVTAYFPLKIKILAKEKCEFCTFFAIS